MSCPKTRHLLTEYFDDSLSSVARAEVERHLEGCEHCAAELTELLAVQDSLQGWQQQRVPHWDRGTSLFRNAHQKSSGTGIGVGSGRIWQWLPTAASFAMFALLLFNVSITSSGNGFTVTFGNAVDSMEQQQLEQQLASFAAAQQQQQEQDLQLFMAQLAERLDSNNLRLMQAVMDQTRELSAQNFEQVYTYFEQQRQLDMETVQVSYQQLLDSDFETLRTMEQLANYVQFQPVELR